MKFNFQRFGAEPTGAALAQQLIDLHGREEFTSPDHLKQVLQATITHNGLALQLGQVGGTINVHGSLGIILRIRPND